MYLKHVLESFTESALIDELTTTREWSSSHAHAGRMEDPRRPCKSQGPRAYSALSKER